MMRAHAANQLDAIDASLIDITDQNIGVQFEYGGTRIASRPGFPADDEIILVLHYAAQALTNDGMVIHDEDAPSATHRAVESGLGR